MPPRGSSAASRWSRTPGKARIPKRTDRSKLPRTDFVARSDAASFAIAIDPSGKLRWRSNHIDDDHVIAVLTTRVSDDYLAFLREKKISYVFGGASRIDLVRVLAKLRAHFGIERLLLEGGGSINGSFLAADLVDELSVIVAPIADGATGVPTLFDTRPRKGPQRHFRLVACERRAGDIAWLRYRRG